MQNPFFCLFGLLSLYNISVTGNFVTSEAVDNDNWGVAATVKKV